MDQWNVANGNAHTSRGVERQQRSQFQEVIFDSRCHQFASFDKECLIILKWPRQTAGDAMMAEILVHLVWVGDASVFQRAAIALVIQVIEILHRIAISDGDVDLCLGDSVVGDLIVSAPAKALFLEMVTRKNMVDVATVEDEIANGDVPGEEPAVIQLCLGSLENKEVWAV